MKIPPYFCILNVESMTTIEKVKEVIFELTNADNIQPDMTLFDLGLDMYKRDVLKCILGVDRIHALTTVNQIVNLIDSKIYDTN